MKIWKSRKAVTPVVAMLLLIAIGVAASVIMYSWITAMIATQSKQASTVIRIDIVTFTESGAGLKDQIQIVIRNTGSVHAVLETAYLIYPEGTRADFDLAGTAVTPGETVTLTLSLTTAWEPAKAYLIKIVTDTGFAVEGTFYSPAE